MFLVQDHVSATFGSGLAYACVIDVGDQKTSVSCVEDGICHPNTRVRLEYGGGDITQIFYWLLQKCAFPYKECDEQVRKWSPILDDLKYSFRVNFCFKIILVYHKFLKSIFAHLPICLFFQL